MLNTKYPEIEKLNTYLNNFAEHKGPTVYSIGRDSRFKLPRNAGDPGPGQYRVERDYPESEKDDIGTQHRTGIRVPPKYSIPNDSRTGRDGSLKGIAITRNATAPGQYEMHKMGTRSTEKSFPLCTMPSAKESAEAVRDRKKAAGAPGPGVNNIARWGDDLGLEKQKKMERAVRRGTNCWAAGQYTHVFGCMKPKSGSMPCLSVESSTTKIRKAPDAGAQPLAAT